jgi:hypothetical protein
MLVRQVERALMPLELSLAQYRVLGLIGENDAGALFHSLRIGASRAGITLLVDGLVERGYVVRREDTHDRRRVVLGSRKPVSRCGRQPTTPRRRAVARGRGDGGGAGAPRVARAVERRGQQFVAGGGSSQEQ